MVISVNNEAVVGFTQMIEQEQLHRFFVEDGGLFGFIKMTGFSEPETQTKFVKVEGKRAYFDSKKTKREWVEAYHGSMYSQMNSATIDYLKMCR